jgi:hypothetical protein
VTLWMGGELHVQLTDVRSTDVRTCTCVVVSLCDSRNLRYRSQPDLSISLHPSRLFSVSMTTSSSAPSRKMEGEDPDCSGPQPPPFPLGSRDNEGGGDRWAATPSTPGHLLPPLSLGPESIAKEGQMGWGTYQSTEPPPTATITPTEFPSGQARKEGIPEMRNPGRRMCISQRTQNVTSDQFQGRAPHFPMTSGAEISLVLCSNPSCSSV